MTNHHGLCHCLFAMFSGESLNHFVKQKSSGKKQSLNYVHQHLAEPVFLLDFGSDLRLSHGKNLVCNKC